MKPKHRVNRHHRVPRSRGGGNNYENISVVREADHRAYHQLFGNMLAHEIAAMLTNTWIDRNLCLVAVPRVKEKNKQCRWVFCTEAEAETLEKIRQHSKKELHRVHF